MDDPNESGSASRRVCVCIRIDLRVKEKLDFDAGSEDEQVSRTKQKLNSH